MDKKYLIIYHFEDNDGCCSCAIMKYYLINELGVDENNITLFGANYAILSKVYADNFNFILNNKEYNILDFDAVVMTDVSFNECLNKMEGLYEAKGFVKRNPNRKAKQTSKVGFLKYEGILWRALGLLIKDSAKHSHINWKSVTAICSLPDL